jgi:hypothetical protein
MPAIITVGGYQFVLKSDAAALAVMKAMGDAVEVDSDFINGQYVYFPGGRIEGRQTSVEMKIIHPKQLMRCNPKLKQTATEVETKLLDYPGKVHFQ